MSAMPEEVLKEIAATNEPPNRLASSEFFFLLQRIDRLDEKLSGRVDGLQEKIDRLDEKFSREIKEVDLKLSARIDNVEEKIDRLQDRLDLVQDRVDSIKFWTIGAVITLIAGFAGVIITLLQK
ncbi:RepA / Rep+ protein KID [Moorella sp. E308F]|nr:RepA / Rep+ protein KID [Moorella sp. E308F]